MEQNTTGVKKLVTIIVVLVVALAAIVIIRKVAHKDTEGLYDIGMAHVESVDVVLKESFPVQVDVLVKGTLPDGCTELGDVRQELTGTTFHVTLETRKLKDGDVVCTQALEDFETTIALKNVVGISAGEYVVDVNGVQKAFTMDVDNYISNEDPLK